jgi:hypothetical protein
MLANPANAAVSRVSASATAVTLAAAQTIRVGLIVYNDSTSDLYLKFGSSASTTDFTYFIPAGGTWESVNGVSYTGIVTGIWTTATGAAQVTELT